MVVCLHPRRLEARQADRLAEEGRLITSGSTRAHRPT